jgi:hypothetical protein
MALDRVMKYLAGTPHLGIVYHATDKTTLQLEAYAGASFRNEDAHKPRLVRSLADPNCYTYFSDTLIVLMCVNVDDYYIAHNDDEWYSEFIKRYSSRGTKLKDEGVVSRWFGINYKWTFDSDGGANSVSMSQSSDVLGTIGQLGLLDSSPIDTPMDSGFDSTPVPQLDYVAPDFPYASAVGSLLWYARMTRPDILTATSLLACHTARFSDRHVKAVKRVYRYLLGTHDYALCFHRDPDFDLKSISFAALADADWAADKIGRRSMIGFSTVLCTNPTTFAAKHWPRPCLSTLEAEYIALTFAAKEALFIHYFFNQWEPYLCLSHPIPFFSDSAGAISFAENDVTISQIQQQNTSIHVISFCAA